MQKGPKQFQPRCIAACTATAGRKERQRSKPPKQLTCKTHVTNVAGMYVEKPTSLCFPKTDPIWYHDRDTIFNASLSTREVRTNPCAKSHHLHGKHPVTSKMNVPPSAPPWFPPDKPYGMNLEASLGPRSPEVPGMMEA